MSNFGDSEAEEDSLDESLSNKSGDEDEDDEEEEKDDANDIINDEEEESGDEEAHHGHHHRKRTKHEAEELDEEDLSLIEENLGIRLQRKKPRLKKVKLLDSDDDEEDQGAENSATTEREAIANELFEGAEDTAEVPIEPPVQPQVDDTYADIDDSDESEEDVDDFIVDDEGNPIKHAKKKKRIPGTVQDSALMEAQDIFGLDFDFDEFEKYGREDYSSGEEEDDYLDEDDEDGVLRRPKKKSTKKSIYEVFEPSELEKGMLTAKDNEVRTADVPERFQVRDFPVKSSEEGELDDEADWIYRHAFLETPISQQQDIFDGDMHSRTKLPKPVSAVNKIKEALNLMRNHLFEVPFIANYRKEYIEPELNIEDLWKVWAWDEKWSQLRTRKDNLHRLFQEMQDYQFHTIQENGDQPLDENTRILQAEDIDRLDAVESMEQLKDVYSHFMLYYKNDISAMWEAKKKRKQAEGDTADGETNATLSKQKMPAKRDLYTICRHAGVSGLARKFGLTPDQFGENLRDNYQRHETQQHPMEPEDTAESYLSSTFSTVIEVLEAAQHMVAMQIARDPLVRQCVRQTFYERAKLKIKPTKKGKKEIDESHACSPFKYVKNKPVRDLVGDQFLRMCKAEEDGLLTISITIDLDKNAGYHTYFDEVKQLYYRDEFSHLVQEWNTQRMNALARAFNQMLYPLFEKELKLKLLEEAKASVIDACCRRLKSWIEVAPYQPEQHVEEQEFDDSVNSEGLRVLACSISPNPDTPAFLAMLDGGGQVNDYLRLRYLLNRRNTNKAKEREDKEKDLTTLKQFILKKRPQVIVVAAECREAIAVVDDMKMCIAELEQENQIPSIPVEALDGEVARVFMGSPRSENEFREYPPLLRHAVSLGRRIQDPLSEFAALCVEEDELLCLRLHPFQDHVAKEQLVKCLHQEFVTVVNDVGVDPNRLLEHPHTVALLQFVCGLGPRKASFLLKSLRQQCTRLENRSQLVTVCGLGPQVFLNCAGFIKIDTSAISDSTTNYIEVLDGSRVHPETYEWAKKMAVDALEYDEATMESNPSSALEEILETPDRLKDLDLDAFAEELERQGYGNKRITLYDIRDELFGQYRERRLPYRALTVEERFRLLTGETSETLYVGKMVVCGVTGFANRKPPRDMIDQAQPVRNEETGQWQCPFCLQDTFPDLSEVWTHLDNGSCPGQAIGVRTRLENGLSGFIPTKMISDKRISSPRDRVKVGMNLHCRVTRINMERLQLDLTCRSSDLLDKEGKYSPLKDKYFDEDAADVDKKEEEAAKKKANRPKYVKRVIVHPSFKNISFKEAERLLAEMEQGECIVRPSSKGADHLTVTWKVDEGVYQHVDVREEGKENAFSLGRSLWIDSEEFEDLDEIIARHVQPMASFAREILNHKNYRAVDGNKTKLEEILLAEKRKAPQRIPYLLSTTKDFPGKFFLGYLPRVKARVEYVSVTPDGFRYRGRVHATLNGLFKWFKEHFRDPIPGTPRQRMPVAMSESNTPYTPGGTPSINVDVDPARLVPQLQQHFPRGIADPKVYSAALAAVRQRQESQKKTPTQLTPAQWGAAAAQHIQRQNKQRAQQTPTQETPTQQGYQQFPQYGYYQQHQDQSQTPTYGYQQTYSGKKSSSKEGSKSR
ncbi:transcription elongation factor SPT6-like [Acropora muricata]|uniref:transcription elongation factor SPT6-like n=1 Tax=Acropora muricata TaxID=159855 RepID=UPI0034E44DD8